VLLALSVISPLTRRREQITRLFIMQFSSTSCHLISPRSKFSPQHPVLKHPQSMFLFQCQRPSFRPIQNHGQNYNSVYSNFYVFRQQTRIQKVLNWMVASITQIQFPLNFLLNQILTHNAIIVRIWAKFPLCFNYFSVLSPSWQD
jgi:hypothetical protein